MKTFDRLAGRRPTAGIQAVEFPAPRVIDDREEIAANAVPHGGDDGHGRVGSHGGVNRVATSLENRDSRLRGQR